MSDPNLSSFIWSVADLLRGDYKQSEYGKVILPFTDAVDLVTRLVVRPASWTALKQKAAAVDLQALPQVVRDNPTFALLFLLVYPHRIGANLVQFLDKSLS